MLSFFFSHPPPLHAAFSALPFIAFSSHFFVSFFLDFLFHHVFSLFCISVLPLQTWHWTWREKLPWGLLQCRVSVTASVFDICIKQLWKNSLFPIKHYAYAQQRVNTIVCFSPPASSHLSLGEAAFSVLLGAFVHVLKTHVPSSCISPSISIFPLFLVSAWERWIWLAGFLSGRCGPQLLAALVVPSEVCFITLSLALSHFLLVFHQDLPLI